MFDRLLNYVVVIFLVWKTADVCEQYPVVLESIPGLGAVSDALVAFKQTLDKFGHQFDVFCQQGNMFFRPDEPPPTFLERCRQQLAGLFTRPEAARQTWDYHQPVEYAQKVLRYIGMCERQSKTTHI